MPFKPSDTLSAFLQKRPWLSDFRQVREEPAQIHFFAYCGFCETLTGYVATLSQLEAWAGGELCQDVFRAKPGELELLISGMCGECFDTLFPEEDNDDPR